MSFSYWGFISRLKVGSERYGFSKVDNQTVLWRKKEIMTFGNIIRSFYIIMSIEEITRFSEFNKFDWCMEAYLGWKIELNEHENEI